MKRILLIVAFLMAVAFISAQGETPMVQAGTVTTVQQAKLAGLDTPVSLSGQVVNRIGDDLFILKDDTGEIRVKADAGSISKLHLEPDSRVRVKGAMEPGLALAEVEAVSLSVN